MGGDGQQTTHMVSKLGRLSEGDMSERENRAASRRISRQLRDRSCNHMKKEVIKGRTGPAGSEQKDWKGVRELAKQISGKGSPGGGNSWSKCLEVGSASWFWKKSKEASVTAAGGQEEETDSEDPGQMERNGAHHKDFYLSVTGSPCGF